MKDKTLRYGKKLFIRNPSDTTKSINERITNKYGKAFDDDELDIIRKKYIKKFKYKIRRLIFKIKVFLFGRNFWFNHIGIRHIIVSILLGSILFIVENVFNTIEIKIHYENIYSLLIQVLGVLLGFILLVKTFEIQSMYNRVDRNLSLINTNIENIKVLGIQLHEKNQYLGELINEIYAEINMIPVNQWPQRFSENEHLSELIKEFTEYFYENETDFETNEIQIFNQIMSKLVNIEMICSSHFATVVIEKIWMKRIMWIPVLQLIYLLFISIIVMIITNNLNIENSFKNWYTVSIIFLVIYSIFHMFQEVKTLINNEMDSLEYD